MAWLDSVNREREQRGGAQLERCLLSAHGDVFRVPWEDLVYPQFISRTNRRDDEKTSVQNRDTNSRNQDVEVLPSRTSQSAASSEGEDSEGEYVELSELPLPRFSPQKGSLTQSISLQNRGRNTRTDAAACTSRTSSQAEPAEGITLHSNTLNLHPKPETCNKHEEEGRGQEEQGQVGLRCEAASQKEKRNGEVKEVQPSEIRRPGEDSDEKVKGGGEELPVKAEEVELKEEIQEETEEEKQVTSERERKEGDEEEESTEQRETYKDSYFERIAGQSKQKGSYINRFQQKKMYLYDVQNHTEIYFDENKAEQSCTEGLENNSRPIHAESSYSESTEETSHKNSCFEGSVETSPKNSYFEGTVETAHVNSYFESNKQISSKDSYFEVAVQPQLSHDFYFENALQKCTENGKPLTEDFYSERLLPVQTPKPCFENKTLRDDSVSEITSQALCQNSYSENTLPTQLEGFNLENTPQLMQPEYLTPHSTKQAQPEDSYSGSALQTWPGDSYFESTSQTSFKNFSEGTEQTSSKDSYFENTKQTWPEDCHNAINSAEAHSGDSYSEGVPQAKDNYFEGRVLSRPALVSSSPLGSEPQPSRLAPAASPGQIQCPSSYSESIQRGGAEAAGDGSAESRPEDVSSELDQSPTEPEHPPAAPVVTTQNSQLRFHDVLLRSGAVCLPGCRDRGGRALLTVCPAHSVWAHPECDGAALLHLLLFYSSTLQKERLASGLTVLVDSRGAPPAPVLFSALRSLQEGRPGSIHSVLILAKKDSVLHLDKHAASQVELLSSWKSLQKHVELQQLPADFGGTFSFSQSSWIAFRARVELLTNQCNAVVDLLQEAISVLQDTPLPAVATDARLLLSRYEALMRSVLQDARLGQLQQEGGASLSWLRREEAGGTSEQQREAVRTVSALYEQVDELLHRLVTLSNSRTQEVHFILDFWSLEDGFSQVRAWLEEVGEVHLKSLEEPADSLELLSKKQQDFKEFYATAYDQCKRGEELLGRLERWNDMSSSNLHVYELKVHSFWAQLQDFSQRVKSSGQNIERAVQLYCFLDQAYGWALEGMRQLAAVSMEDCTQPEKCRTVIGRLEEYRQQHPPIPDGLFQEMKAEAGELRGERGLCQWSFAWSKCQETRRMFDRKMEAALRTRDSAHRRRSDSSVSLSSTSSRKSLSGLWGRKSSACSVEEESGSSPPATPQHTPLLQRLFRSSSSEEATDQREVSKPHFSRLSSSPSFSPPCSSPPFLSFSRKQQLRKTQSFDCPPTPEGLRCGAVPRTLSEPGHRGNTGVFIRGLEVSSTEAADRALCSRTGAQSRTGPPLETPETPVAEPRPRGRKLRHIVEEMVTTEREYVRSLHYIIHHYFPEMERADLPQDLRGKRSIVFGNLEKLLDFHSQFFLKELEACWRHPLRVPHCFLRHQEQFGLYALYSKNKPKSDALLASHGHAFFRRKQLELGDKMDLSSYLLKPVQRMSKYALLLTDLMKEVGVAQEAELAALQAATNMVKFQLRHGNDLLAMDAIRDCDVNLKEQGQLIRQDEFTVWSGRRKCQRHIFLFQDLVLFSKLRKVEGGLDVFLYKQSYKTADIGLTESTGDSGLRFEIWFRRRTSKNQTFIFQAASAEIKRAWTGDIARILWTQAARNKEMRLKEMVSMGVGSKPFLDIQPSDAAISNRAVHYIMKTRGARTRASIAVSTFDHSHPFQRGCVISEDPASGPCSSSLLGPLNLHMYGHGTHLHSESLPPPDSSFSSCIEEDEQEHETSSQPSMTTESSSSSSRCLSGSTGSDSGCASSHLQEALSAETNPIHPPSSSPNKPRLHYLTPEAAAVVAPATVL